MGLQFNNLSEISHQSDDIFGWKFFLQETAIFRNLTTAEGPHMCSTCSKNSRHLVWRDKGDFAREWLQRFVPCLTTDVPYPGRSGPESLTMKWFWSNLSWKSSGLAKTSYTDWLLIISPCCILVAKSTRYKTSEANLLRRGKEWGFLWKCRIAGRIKKLSKRLDMQTTKWCNDAFKHDTCKMWLYLNLMHWTFKD